MKIVDIIKRLVYVPKCVCCGGTEELTVGALCPECLKKFEEESKMPCPFCGDAIVDCECFRNSYIKRAFFLAPYNKSEESVTRALVLAGKTYGADAVYELEASRLAESIMRAERCGKIDISSGVVAYIPRNPVSVREEGVDQAKEIARKMAKKLGLPLAKCLTHKASHTSQKELDMVRRAANAVKSFGLDDKRTSEIARKTVILVDDVVTSGSSVTCCARLLVGAGADTVYVAAVARTVRNRKEN